MALSWLWGWSSCLWLPPGPPSLLGVSSSGQARPQVGAQGVGRVCTEREQGDVGLRPQQQGGVQAEAEAWCGEGGG